MVQAQLGGLLLDSLCWTENPRFDLICYWGVAGTIIILIEGVDPLPHVPGCVHSPACGWHHDLSCEERLRTLCLFCKGSWEVTSLLPTAFIRKWRGRCWSLLCNSSTHGNGTRLLQVRLHEVTFLYHGDGQTLGQAFQDIWLTAGCFLFPQSSQVFCRSAFQYRLEKTLKDHLVQHFYHLSLDQIA